MHIRFLRLWVKNFLSTGNVEQEIQLDGSFITLIVGIIVESESGMKNGAGKTTILQAISYALYGKPLTRIKIQNLCNNINKKQMVVRLEFQVGDSVYRIERGQKPAFMRFFVNNKEVEQDSQNDALGENKSTQAEINRIIGMSHLMFKHTLALNTFTEPFLKERDAVQREIIEELLGFAQISARAEKLKAIIGTTKDRIKQIEAHISATTSANSRIERTLRDLEQTERTWTRDHKTAVAEILANIEALEQIDFEEALRALDARDAYDVEANQCAAALMPVDHKHDEAVRAIKEIDRELSRMAEPTTNSDGSRTQRELGRRQNEMNNHQGQIETAQRKIERLTTDLDRGDGVCSTCGQPLSGTDHLAKVREEIGKAIEQQRSDIDKRRAAIGDIQADIAAIQSEQAAADANAQAQATLQAERSAVLVADRVRQERTIAMCKEYQNGIGKKRAALGPRPEVTFESRDELYQMRSASAVLQTQLQAEQAKKNPYSAQVVTIRTTLQKIDYAELNETSSDLKHQDFLMKLLTSKDSFVRKKIVDQNLPYLNARIAHYLQALTLPHTVVFQSDLTVEINHLGNDYDFEQLSRGEMNRVIMATAFAFRDVWESLNHSVNLLWVDELLDQGTCTPGVEAALGILKEMGVRRGKNVFLVSHKDELRSRINDILLCNKSKEFTTFEAGASI